jgi:2-polyprenyl-3-methyl-5-hydroxy-6-metoxy-1,4-benzoquinol methylase
MGENISGFYAILRLPAIFNALHHLVVRQEARQILVDEYIKPSPGDRLLDIGCGPAPMLSYLPDVVYTGLDLEPNFIDFARAQHGKRATFIHARVQELASRLNGEFDLALAIGVVHHIDDSEAHELFRAVETLLRPGGRLIVSDPVFRNRQNPIARLVMRLDRGKSIRSKEGYLALAGTGLPCIQTDLRSDFLRIPYDHCISVYQKPASSATT